MAEHSDDDDDDDINEVFTLHLSGLHRYANENLYFINITCFGAKTPSSQRI